MITALWAPAADYRTDARHSDGWTDERGATVLVARAQTFVVATGRTAVGATHAVDPKLVEDSATFSRAPTPELATDLAAIAAMAKRVSVRRRLGPLHHPRCGSWKGADLARHHGSGCTIGVRDDGGWGGAQYRSVVN